MVVKYFRCLIRLHDVHFGKTRQSDTESGNPVLTSAALPFPFSLLPSFVFSFAAVFTCANLVPSEWVPRRTPRAPPRPRPSHRRRPDPEAERPRRRSGPRERPGTSLTISSSSTRVSETEPKTSSSLDACVMLPRVS